MSFNRKTKFTKKNISGYTPKQLCTAKKTIKSEINLNQSQRLQIDDEESLKQQIKKIDDVNNRLSGALKQIKTDEKEVQDQIKALENRLKEIHDKIKQYKENSRELLKRKEYFKDKIKEREALRDIEMSLHGELNIINEELRVLEIDCIKLEEGISIE